MRTVPLSRGLVAILDDEDFDRVSPFKWHAHPGGRTTYASTNGERSSVLLHRFILEAGDSHEVDHLNGDGLDNRRSNIRLCSRSENSCNVGKRPARGGVNPSRFKGVTWHRRDGLWRARIRKDHREFVVGYFKSEEAAARAYDDAARRLHREFARLNFPEAM